MPTTIADLPGPPPKFIVGNALDIKKHQFHIMLDRWQAEYGDTFVFQVGSRKLIGTANPSHITKILKSRPEVFRRSSRVATIFEESGVKGVFTAEGEEWKKHRRLVNTMLGRANVESYFPTLQGIAQNLLDYWTKVAEEGRETNLQDDFMRFTVDVTTTLAFGVECNSIQNPDEPLIKHMAQIFPTWSRRIQSPIAYWRHFRLSQDRKFDESMSYVRQWFDEVLAQTKARLADAPEDYVPSNLIESMLTTPNANGEPYSNDDIFGNAVTMLLAGEDTTANTMAWVCHFLMDHPNWSESLTQDAEQLLDGRSMAPSYASAMNYRALTSVIHESLRLKPVGPFLNLEALVDTTVDDLEIKAGQIVTVVLRPAAMNPSRADNPTAFDPTRWDTPERSAKLKESGVFVPFGDGVRVCPGRSLALLEIRMVISMLLTQFTLHRVGESDDVKEELRFTMGPEALPVRLKTRVAANAQKNQSTGAKTS